MIKNHHYEISDEIDWMAQRLAPLLQGYCVTLLLEQPKVRGTKKNQLITIVPGIQFGFRDSFVVVSIIGSGSAIIDCKLKKISSLCLAGLPAKLASVLADKLFTIYKDI